MRNRRKQFKYAAILGACCVCSSIGTTATITNANLLSKFLPSIRVGVRTAISVNRQTLNPPVNVKLRKYNAEVYRTKSEIKMTQRQLSLTTRKVINFKKTNDAIFLKGYINDMEERLRVESANMSNERLILIGRDLINFKSAIANYEKDLKKVGVLTGKLVTLNIRYEGLKKSN